jgi:hypothetical protein
MHWTMKRKRQLTEQLLNEKDAMESALRLFKTFDMDDGPLLHRSKIACVLKVFEPMSGSNAISGGNGSRDAAATRVLIPKTLKCMVEIGQVRTY